MPNIDKNRTPSHQPLERKLKEGLYWGLLMSMPNYQKLLSYFILFLLGVTLLFVYFSPKKLRDTKEPVLNTPQTAPQETELSRTGESSVSNQGAPAILEAEEPLSIQTPTKSPDLGFQESPIDPPDSEINSDAYPNEEPESNLNAWDIEPPGPEPGDEEYFEEGPEIDSDNFPGEGPDIDFNDWDVDPPELEPGYDTILMEPTSR